MTVFEARTSSGSKLFSSMLLREVEICAALEGLKAVAEVLSVVIVFNYSFLILILWEEKHGNSFGGI
jgi:hypothetical protein